MESDEVLNCYINEVKDTNNEVEIEDVLVPNEAEQATDFLQKVGLADMTRLYNQGKEISDNLVNDSVRQKNLTTKQAQTVRSRVNTLNKTLRNRQPKRKQRQDIRDIAWNAETSSIGTRSRSATPDSLDSVDVLNDECQSDEDQQLSSLPLLLDPNHAVFKTRIKWTSSEPLQNKKLNRNDKCDIAHLGSENVILKGYQPLSEYGSLIRTPRERSGSDPTTEVHLQPLKNCNTDVFIQDTKLSKSQTSLNNCSRVYLNGKDNEQVSFEGLLKQNENTFPIEVRVNLNNLTDLITIQFQLQDNECKTGVSIDELSDSEYQYLKPILYLELVTIFDQYKIDFVKRKATSKNKGGNVFGVNLSTLVMRDMPSRPIDSTMVPEIFQSLLRHLNTRCIKEDGILRIAGQIHKLEILCNEVEMKFFNDRQHVENLLGQATGHELTGVLKKLLREVPDSILTMELFDMFYKTSLITNNEDKVKALNLLVLMLPVEHRNTFRLLLGFFINIIKNEEYNRMNLHNVAMITAPSLFPPRLILPKNNNSKVLIKQLTREELAKQINGAAVCCCIMETLLKAGKNLWLIPGNLANQARDAQKKAQNRKDKDKQIRSGKKKLSRSSTQYESGAMNIPRIKKDYYI